MEGRTEPNVVWKPLPGSQTLLMNCPADVILLGGSRGGGKDLQVDTPVLTDSGWKRAGDVELTDMLVAEDGSYTVITGIYPKKDRDMYRIKLYDGAEVIADAEHRWKVMNAKKGYKLGWQVKTTKEIADSSCGYSIPKLSGPVRGKEWKGLDPYAIGYIIANGTTRSRYVAIYSIDDEILDYFKDVHGWHVYKYEQTARRAVAYNDSLSEPWFNYLGKEKGDSKYVPQELLYADANTRLALLQGLMDGDGNCESGAKSRYSTVSEQLAKDVTYLVKSLGGWASYVKRIENTTLGDRGYCYYVNISHNNKFNPFRLKRKADKWVKQTKFLNRGIKSVEYIGKDDGVCFAVEHESHCFLCGDFVITHNTESQLMRFRMRVGQGYGRFWRGIIMDRTYKNLDDMVSKSQRIFTKFGDGAKFHGSKADYKWVWPSGEELLFRVGKSEEDYWDYHGQEFPYIGYNELTRWPNLDLYDKMMSCNRSSFRPEDYPQYINGKLFDKDGRISWVSDNHKHARKILLPKIPLEVVSTTNPHGVGHGAVKKRFIDPAKPGQLVRTTTTVFNPQVQKDVDVTKTQVYLFSSYRENKYLTPEYVAELENISDPNLRKAWLFGSWEIVSGGIFDGVYDKDTVIIKPFVIPQHWRIDRSFDYGSSRPFSVGWWAESDGCDVILPDGKVMSTVKGDIFRFAEWYGTSGKTNEGLKMLATEIAAGIIERELAMGIHGRCNPGPADNAIWNVDNGNCVASDMAKRVRVNGRLYNGVEWSRSDKSPGSRIAGWEKIRTYLSNAKQKFVKSKSNPDLLIPIPRENPGLFAFNTCGYFKELFPNLPRDEKNLDDVDTDAEDHLGDEVRYKVLSMQTGARSGTTSGT